MGKRSEVKIPVTAGVEHPSCSLNRLHRLIYLFVIVFICSFSCSEVSLQPDGTVQCGSSSGDRCGPGQTKAGTQMCCRASSQRGEVGISTGLNPASELVSSTGIIQDWKDTVRCQLALWEPRMGLARLPLPIFRLKFSPKLWDVHLFEVKPSRACAARGDSSWDPLPGCGVM